MTTDKDNKDARDIWDIAHRGLTTYGDDIALIQDMIARIRAEARGELCINCENRIRAEAKAEERQRAAERICAIHCGSNENQTPTRWDGKCLYFDTCTYVSTILADDKEKV